MNIYIYSDESGVFDYKHNQYYIFGGVVFLSKEDRDNAARAFLSLERTIRKQGGYSEKTELKAYILKLRDKQRLFSSLNGVQKFAAIIKQDRIHKRIWADKKTKQRYLDYAYKIAVKRLFEHLIETQQIDPSKVGNLYFFVDEHNTATDGCYELRESLEQEFKMGTFNGNWNRYFPPIFRNLQNVHLTFCNSSKKTLIRAADIVSNRLLWNTKQNVNLVGTSYSMMFVTHLP